EGVSKTCLADAIVSMLRRSPQSVMAHLPWTPFDATISPSASGLAHVIPSTAASPGHRADGRAHRIEEVAVKKIFRYGFVASILSGSLVVFGIGATTVNAGIAGVPSSSHPANAAIQ